MGLYREQILPWVTHFFMKNQLLSKERDLALEEVSGDVLELGFGSGLNLTHYPGTVRRVTGVDPSGKAAEIAKKQIRAVSFPVEIRSQEAESLDVAREQFDSLVSTFSLCTIPDVPRALAQAKRALKPSGRFYFLEHGLSEEPDVQKWQRRMEPLHKRIAGGCHLTRDMRALIEGAGFEIERLEKYYVKGPKPMSFMYRGVARPRNR